jgi:HJR/Mrr/RecB family endonuclease
MTSVIYSSYKPYVHTYLPHVTQFCDELALATPVHKIERNVKRQNPTVIHDQNWSFCH